MYRPKRENEIKLERLVRKLEEKGIFKEENDNTDTNAGS